MAEEGRTGSFKNIPIPLPRAQKTEKLKMEDYSPDSPKLLVSRESTNKKIVMGSAPAQGKAALDL